MTCTTSQDLLNNNNKIIKIMDYQTVTKGNMNRDRWVALFRDCPLAYKTWTNKFITLTVISWSPLPHCFCFFGFFCVHFGVYRTKYGLLRYTEHHSFEFSHLPIVTSCTAHTQSKVTQNSFWKCHDVFVMQTVSLPTYITLYGNYMPMFTSKYFRFSTKLTLQ